jgi:integrase
MAMMRGECLRKRGRNWYAVKEIAPSERHLHGGKKRIVRTLGTPHKIEALRRRAAVLAEIEAQLERARRGKHGLAANEAELANEAMAHRWRLESDRDEERAVQRFQDMTLRSFDVEDRFGKAAGKDFAAVAMGKATPITFPLEDWLQEKRYAKRTKYDHRHAVAVLKEWIEGEDLPATLETVTGRLAGHFKTERLVKTGMDPRTANKLLSGLKSYWTWLEKHEHVEVNPWAGKSLHKGRASSDERERPFSNDEVRRLFDGNPDQETRDVMMLGALTGMRLEETFRLKVADCAGGVFQVRKSKTAAGERVVPVHRDLVEVVKRRSKGKQPADFLIEGAKETGWDGARSMNFSRNFRRYRERCHVDDKPEGRRRSRVNFHSFRRWFATKAEQAGHHETLAYPREPMTSTHSIPLGSPAN